MKKRNSKLASGNPLLYRVNIAISLLLVPLCMSPAGGRADKRKTKDRVVSYSVISNDVTRNPAIDYERRIIDVLIDPADFTQEKLRKLLDYLFKKYRAPANMSVYLYSHPIQLRDLGIIEQIKPNDEAEKHPYGRLSRIDGKEEISYKLPSNADWITIVVKERGEPKEK